MQVDTKVVDLTNGDVVVRRKKCVRGLYIGLPWHSIRRPAGLNSNMITTELCRLF